MKNCFLINTDGTWYIKGSTDGDLREVIGGYLAILSGPRGKSSLFNKELMVYGDEEGFLKGLPRNDLGERILHALGFHIEWSIGLCGPLVFTLTSKSGVLKSLSENDIASLIGMCKEAMNVDFDESDDARANRIRSAIVKPAASRAAPKMTPARSKKKPRRESGGIRKKPRKTKRL